MGEEKGTVWGAPEATNVWHTTEDSFIIGVACGKTWRAQKPESLGV